MHNKVHQPIAPPRGRVWTTARLPSWELCLPTCPFSRAELQDTVPRPVSLAFCSHHLLPEEHHLQHMVTRTAHEISRLVDIDCRNCWQPRKWTTDSIFHSCMSPCPSHCLLATGMTRDIDRADYSPHIGCMVGLGSQALDNVPPPPPPRAHDYHNYAHRCLLSHRRAE